MYQHNFTTSNPAAERIATNLKRFKKSDMDVTLQTTVWSGRQETYGWYGDHNTKRTISAGPYAISTAVTCRATDQLLGHQPNEQCLGQTSVYHDDECIGGLSSDGRFIYTGAPDVATMIIYLAATNIGKERMIGSQDLDPNAIELKLRKIAKRALPGESYKESHIRLYRGEFRNALKQIQQQYQIWRAADGYLFDGGAIWEVCTRSIFGRRIDVSTRESEMF